MKENTDKPYIYMCRECRTFYAVESAYKHTRCCDECKAKAIQEYAEEKRKELEEVVKETPTYKRYIDITTKKEKEKFAYPSSVYLQPDRIIQLLEMVHMKATLDALGKHYYLKLESSDSFVRGEDLEPKLYTAYGVISAHQYMSKKFPDAKYLIVAA